MIARINGMKIEGIAAAVSTKWDSLLECSTEDPMVVEKFIRKTSVRGRWSASPRQTTSDFCFAAAEKLIAEKQIDKGKIGVLVFVTQTADYTIPATACLLQHRLGLPKTTIAFDVNLGCSGYVYGLNILTSILENCEAEYGLLLAGDTSAREKSQKVKVKTSHSASLLFGDSGTATLIRKSPSPHSIDFVLSTNGEGYKAIWAPYDRWRNPDVPEGETNGSRMDDIEVFNFATSAVVDQINEYMAMEKTTSDDYDALVLHQANMMIMKRIAKKTGFSMDKTLVSIDTFGNTSSASIPITLVNTYGGSIEERNIHALCCGFGVGLSWGTVGIHVNTANILPLIHTDEFFRDGYNMEDKEENKND